MQILKQTKVSKSIVILVKGYPFKEKSGAFVCYKPFRACAAILLCFVFIYKANMTGVLTLGYAIEPLWELFIEVWQ